MINEPRRIKALFSDLLYILYIYIYTNNNTLNIYIYIDIYIKGVVVFVFTSVPLTDSVISRDEMQEVC